jgi:HlyD family secretion protein
MKRAVLLVALLLAACSESKTSGWLGYAEGDTVLVAPPKGGWITSVPVAQGATVHEGDVLFTLDADDQTAARSNAVASIAVANAAEAKAVADITRTQKELARQRSLAKIGGTSTSSVEQAESSYRSALASRDSAVAQRNAGEATLAQSEYGLSERNVRARVSGQVQDIYFRQGEYANAGTPVIELLPKSNIYVRFFVPEEELQSVALNKPVHIGCDGCPPNLQAKVSFIASEAEYTPPVIYSVTNRKKLVFKVEARAPDGLELRPGLPINVTLAQP